MPRVISSLVTCKSQSVRVLVIGRLENCIGISRTYHWPQKFCCALFSLARCSGTVEDFENLTSFPELAPSISEDFSSRETRFSSCKPKNFRPVGSVSFTTSHLLPFE